MKDLSRYARTVLAGNLIPYIPRRVHSFIGGGYDRWTTFDEKEVVVSPNKAKNVLIGPKNSAGQGYLWAKAIGQIPNVGAVSMEYLRKDTPLVFPADFAFNASMVMLSRRWDKRNFKAIIEGFTHVFIESQQPILGGMQNADPLRQAEYLQELGMTVASISHGSDIRQPLIHRKFDLDSPFHQPLGGLTKELTISSAQNHKYLDALGVPEFVSTPDQLMYRPNATWLPTLIDLEYWLSIPRPAFGERVPVVLHIPSRASLKGTPTISPAMLRLQDQGHIVYLEASGISPGDMWKMVSAADIVIDQIGIGAYGVASLEAMAAGRVVVAHVWDSTRQFIAKETGLQLPIVQADSKTITEVVQGLAGDPATMEKLSASGRQYVQKVHSDAAVRRAVSPLFK